MPLQAHVDTLRLTSSVAPGTIYTRTGYGFRPKFLFIWGTAFADGDEVAAGDCRMQVGFATPNGEFSAGIISVDAGATAETGRFNQQAAWAGCSNAATTTVLQVASFDADGVTLITTLSGSSFRIHILALGGDDIAAIGVTTFVAAAGATQDVDAFGFQPDCVMLLSTAITSALNSFSATDSSFSFGVCDTALNNAVLAVAGDDGAATTVTRSYCRSGDIVHMWPAGANSTEGRARVSAWRPNGFTLTWDNQTAVAGFIHAIAIKGVQCALKTGTTQTDTTTDISISSIGFTPVGGLVCGASRAQDAADTPTAHAHASIGAFAGPSNENAAAMRDNDNLADAQTCTATELDACLINISASDTLDGSMHVHSNPLADPLVFRMANADPSGNFFWTLLFGSQAAPAAPDPVKNYVPNIALQRRAA